MDFYINFDFLKYCIEILLILITGVLGDPLTVASEIKCFTGLTLVPALDMTLSNLQHKSVTWNSFGSVTAFNMVQHRIEQDMKNSAVGKT